MKMLAFSNKLYREREKEKENRTEVLQYKMSIKRRCFYITYFI